MMDAAELLYLAAALSVCDWRPGAFVVEIGAFKGQTTVFLAQVLNLLGLRVPVLSVDPFELVQPDPLNPKGSYSDYRETVHRNQLDDNCFPIVAFSEHAAAVIADSIGLLVVDGGHHYDVASRDLELYGPKVIPGGIVFVDDYTTSYPGVMRAVDEYFGANDGFEVVHRSYFVVARRRSGSKVPA
jgi:hypothetical protein